MNEQRATCRRETFAAACAVGVSGLRLTTFQAPSIRRTHYAQSGSANQGETCGRRLSFGGPRQGTKRQNLDPAALTAKAIDGYPRARQCRGILPKRFGV